jgi:hypothetical protein
MHADGLRRRASQGLFESIPVCFKVLDKRSAIAVGPTANVLNVVAAKADRSCPAPAPAATVASCARRLAAPCLGDLNGRGCPAPPLPRQLLREHADGPRRRASRGSIEPMPVYFKALDKRSAIIAVGPTANVLNVVAPEADGECPAPAPAATGASCARRLAASCLGDLNGRVSPLRRCRDSCFASTPTGRAAAHPRVPSRPYLCTSRSSTSAAQSSSARRRTS